ncbi:MAG: ferric reductase-like transmembrane domain-containing protein [Actinomycetales bacterium]
MTSTWIPAYGLWHRRWRDRRADLLEAGAVGSVVVVAAGFLARGGAASLDSGAALFIATGQLTGLVATDLLLIQLLLAARLPWVDRVYGMDRGLKAHRVLGRVTVPLLVVHAGALVVGYAAQERLSPATAWLVEPWHMLHGVPDMLTAFASLTLLVVVAVTSVRLARARLGYERWHLVHLTAYVAVVLSLPPARRRHRHRRPSAGPRVLAGPVPADRGQHRVVAVRRPVRAHSAPPTVRRAGRT